MPSSGCDLLILPAFSVRGRSSLLSHVGVAAGCQCSMSGQYRAVQPVPSLRQDTGGIPGPLNAV